eukprot:65086-Hanusia_phi.AAC.4
MVDDLRELFSSFDQDKSGAIEREELGQVDEKQACCSSLSSSPAALTMHGAKKVRGRGESQTS